MLFNSYEFLLLFLPAVLFGFFALARLAGATMAVGFLVVASLFFYGWWNPAYLPLILFSILFNFTVGLRLSDPARRADATRRALLAAGVITNLGLLGYFKYANFFVTNWQTATGADLAWTKIVLPIAISFFTFQQIAYLVDAYRGETREYRFVNYCLFVCFFPQLIAGPIVHHSEMMPQFENRETYRLDPANLAVGLTIFIIGLFKKVVVADRLATLGTPVFEAAERGDELSFFVAWGGTLAYTFQLYFDFSGYSDMAIGLARMFGIRLPLNFHSPYKATSIIDFWRRWHMTLSRFLRDYLYFALGGNRRGKVRRYANLMIAMVLGGLWHGAGWTFVIWGALHGAFLIINHGWRRLLQAFGRTGESTFFGRTAARLTTFLAVAVAWVFFRAESLDGAVTVLRGMVGQNGVVLTEKFAERLGAGADLLADLGVRFEPVAFKFAANPHLLFGALLLAVWALPNTQQLMRKYDPALIIGTESQLTPGWPALAWRPTVAWAALSSIMGAWVFLKLFMGSESEFIYFQF